METNDLSSLASPSTVKTSPDPSTILSRCFARLRPLSDSLFTIDLRAPQRRRSSLSAPHPTMPDIVLRYTPSGLCKGAPSSIIPTTAILTVTAEHLPDPVVHDRPSFLNKLDNLVIAEASAVTFDSDKEACAPSDPVLERMQRQSTSRFRLVHLARAHICGLAFSEHGFPGYKRTETLLDRAIARARVIIPLQGTLTNRHREMVSIESIENVRHAHLNPPQ